MNRALVLFLFIFINFLGGGWASSQDVDFDLENIRPEDTVGLIGMKSYQCPPVRALNKPLQLLVNHDGHWPIVRIAAHQDQIFPVFYNFSMINDSTVCIEAYLPPEIPIRIPKQPEFRPPQGNFTLFVAYATEIDTAEYRIKFSTTPLLLEVTTIRETGYVELQKLLKKPDDIVLLRFENDDQVAVAQERLRDLMKSVKLKPGNYEGIPFPIEVGEGGINYSPNLGIILALQLPEDPEKRRQVEEQLGHYQIACD